MHNSITSPPIQQELFGYLNKEGRYLFISTQRDLGEGYGPIPYQDTYTENTMIKGK